MVPKSDPTRLARGPIGPGHLGLGPRPVELERIGVEPSRHFPPASVARRLLTHPARGLPADGPAAVGYRPEPRAPGRVTAKVLPDAGPQEVPEEPWELLCIFLLELDLDECVLEIIYIDHIMLDAHLAKIRHAGRELGNP